MGGGGRGEMRTPCNLPLDPPLHNSNILFLARVFLGHRSKIVINFALFIADLRSTKIFLSFVSHDMDLAFDLGLL